MPIPNAVKLWPACRWELVTRVSAYEVPEVDHLDYPKHVEALILRLSKPAGNRCSANLPANYPRMPEQELTETRKKAPVRFCVRQRGSDLGRNRLVRTATADGVKLAA
jgi:hypothetical protein